jgi:hypothetical protein
VLCRFLSMGSKWKMRDKSDIWRQPWPGRLTPESPPHLSLTCESPSNDGARGIPSPQHHYTDDFLRSTMKLFLMVTPPAARIQVTTDSLHRPFSVSGRLRHDVGAERCSPGGLVTEEKDRTMSSALD